MNETPEYVSGFEDGHRFALAEIRHYLLDLPEDEAWVVLRLLVVMTPPSKKEAKQPH